MTGLTNVAGGLKISWNKSSNAEFYAVYRRGVNTNYWTLVGFTTNLSAIDTTPDHRKYWRYTVQALNSNGVSNFDSTGKYTKYILLWFIL